MKSIMHQKDGTCYLCMKLHADYSLKQTQEHHAIHGAGRRKLSEKYGLKVHLCLRHHTADGGPEAVHKNAQIDLLVKKDAQEAFEKRWPALDFRGIFGKNYLEENDRWQQESGNAEQGFNLLNRGSEVNGDLCAQKTMVYSDQTDEIFRVFKKQDRDCKRQRV